MKVLPLFVSILLSLAASQTGYSQSYSIQGPSCVLPGQPISYSINGSWNIGDQFSWCANGGVIQGTASSCKSGANVSNITVTYSHDATSTQLSLSKNSGSTVFYTPTSLSDNQINIAITQNIVSGTAPTPLTSISSLPICSGYTFQWQQNPYTHNELSEDWSDIDGETSSTLTLPTMTQSMNYRRKVTANGFSITSNPVIITVLPPLTGGIIVSSVSQPIVYNTSPGTITSQSDASGGWNGSYSYQWEKSTDNINYLPVSGATGTVLNPGNLVVPTSFRRKVTRGAETAYSNVIQINVYTQLTISSISSPVANTINYNMLPGTINGPTVTGGSCSGSYSYQWSYSTDGTNYSTSPGGATKNYNPGALTVSRYYRITVACGSESKTSNAIFIQVYPQLSPGIISPASQNINYNLIPSQLTGSVASGGNNTYIYQWQSSADNINFTDIAGSTGLNYPPPALLADKYYRRGVTSNSLTVYSNTAVVVVNPALTSGGNITPASITVNYNTSPGQLTGSVPTGGGPSYDYKWQESADNNVWSYISGATGQNYTPVILTTTRYYRREAISNSTSMLSNTSVVYVYPQLQAGFISPAGSNINNNALAPQLTANPSGGSGSYIYQWQSSANNSTWSNISGAVSKEFSPGMLGTTSYYRVIITSNGISVTASSAVISVYDAFNPGSVTPGITNIDYNNTLGTLTANPGGGNGSYTYQWQQAPDNSYWVNVSGATTASYTPGNLSTDQYYRVMVTSNDVTLPSQSAFINVYPQLLLGSVLPDVQNVPPDGVPGTIRLQSVSGGNGIYNYVWQQSTNGTTWTDIPTTNNTTFLPQDATANRLFRVKVTSNGQILYSTTSLLQVQLNAGLIGVSASPVTIGASAALINVSSANNGNCSGVYAYQWERSFDGWNWTVLPSNNLTNLTGTAFYRRKATCGSEASYSNMVTIRVENNNLNVPDTSTTVAVNQPLESIPVYGVGGSATNMNYVRTRTIIKSGITTEAAADALSNIQDVLETTTYLDGFGRSLQIVDKKATSAGKDFVSPIFYNSLGQSYVSFMPYADNASDGNFKTNVAAVQPTFFNNYYGNTESYYYSRIFYDNSPGDNVIEERKAGKSWAGNGRGVKTLGRTNRFSEGVRYWTIGFAETDLPVSTQEYPAGSLAVLESVDEANNIKLSYKDDKGRLILEKVQFGDKIGETHDDWLCTYYVYDDLGRQRAMLSPKAINAIKTNWTLTTAMMNELCYSSFYDKYNKLVSGKIPGAAAIEMVYDSRERLIFERNGIDKKNGFWKFITYDLLDRPTSSGIYRSPSSRTQLQDSVINYTVAATSLSHSYSNDNLVLEQHNGSSLYQAASCITLLPGFNSDSTNEVTLEINSTATTTDVITPTNFLAGVTDSDVIVNKYTYYDDYSFNGALPANITYQGKLSGYTNYNADPANGFSAINTGEQTGSKVRVLGTDSWLIHTQYYDHRKRNAQTLRKDLSGAISSTTMLYNFSGSLISKYIVTKNASSEQTVNSMLYSYHYNLAGKPDSTRLCLNDNLAETKTISYKSYDELGKVSSKKIGVTGTNSQLESFDYAYGILGLMTGMNRSFVTGSNQSNWFGQIISYENGFTLKQYNGQLSGTIWRTRGGEARALGYAYDQFNRLTRSDFTQQNRGAVQWTSDKVNFSSVFGNDDNGNLNKFIQFGLDGPLVKKVDSLDMIYQSNSNKLNYVKDHKNQPGANLRGDFNAINDNATTDYAFDENGNRTKDKNKNIDSIRFNSLNLPEFIQVTGKGTVSFLYDAEGNKIQKKVMDNTVAPAKQIVTDYLGDYMYVNDTLREAFFEEGRVRAVYKKGWPVSYTLDYAARDYLGSYRMGLASKSDTAKYFASMEQEQTQETQLFANIDETRVPKPIGYPEDATTNPNRSVAKLNAQSGQKIGPSLVLRVMAGDTIQVGVKAFYKSGSTSAYTSPVEDMVTALIAAFSGSAITDGIHKGSGAGSPISTINNSLFNQLKSNDPGQNELDKPKAYLNYVAFDDRFEMVNENSAVRQVQNAPDVLQTLASNQFVVKKNGWMHFFVSNETGNDVYFDNLVVQHSGALLEENHYYPYGGLMAGISGRALKGDDFPRSRRMFSNKELHNEEFADGSGLNWYDFDARFYDPEIGSWLSPDAKAAELPGFSPYNYCLSNPVRFIDPDGKLPTDIVYVDRSGQEVHRIQSNTVFKTYIQTSSLASNPALMPINIGWKEVQMPGIITNKEGISTTDAKYQRYDYMIAAMTGYFNLDKNNGMLHLVTEFGNPIPSKEAAKIPDLHPTLVKAMIMQESGVGTNGVSDIMQSNVPGDYSSMKTAYGLVKGEKMTPEKSVSAGIRILATKGFKRGISVDEKGATTYNFNGWQKATHNYNGNGVRNYLEKVTNLVQNTTYLYGGATGPLSALQQSIERSATLRKPEPAPRENVVVPNQDRH